MAPKKAKKAKNAVVTEAPSAEKVVRLYPGSQTRNSSDYLSWRFDLIYKEPVYGWDTVTEQDRDLILHWLGVFEGMTANEIFSGNPGKVYLNPQQIPDAAARARFLEAYDDQDAIHRLACRGLPRLYGFRQGNVFMILWWDPDHRIWPSKKKHT